MVKKIRSYHKNGKTCSFLRARRSIKGHLTHIFSWDCPLNIVSLWHPQYFSFEVEFLLYID
jgi:hypothetical protein